MTGAQVYGADLKLPGMLNAAIKDCPVFGGKVKSFEADKVKGMPGVRHVVQVGDSGVAVVADTWWQAKTALDALPIVWDEGPNAQVSSATIAEMLKAGLDADQAFVRNQNGDAKAALARRDEDGRGGVRLSVPEPRADGADERDGEVHAGPLRGLGADAERRGRVRGDDRPRPGSRPTSARSTRSTSAADSDGAAPSTTT